jgi:chromosome condensin MukBEF MukE localization factor
MATAWGWHRSKVERFLNRVKSEALIETEIKSGKLVITLGRFKHTAVTTKGGEAALEAQSEAITRQNRGIIANKRQLRDESENAETKKISAIPWGVEAI